MASNLFVTAVVAEDLIAMDLGYRVPGMADLDLIEIVQRLGFAGLT